jgi:hypothetical protein
LRYETVYDVLEDSYHWGFEWLAVPLAVALFVLSVRQLRRHDWQMTGYPQSLGNPWIGFVVGGVIMIVSTGIAYSRIAEQYRCKNWSRSGEFQIVQGEISGSQCIKGRYAFTVAGVALEYHADSAGFRGAFTTPGVPRELLRDGQVVRIAHHERRILRIEIPSR